MNIVLFISHNKKNIVFDLIYLVIYIFFFKCNEKGSNSMKNMRILFKKNENFKCVRNQRTKQRSHPVFVCKADNEISLTNSYPPSDLDPTVNTRKYKYYLCSHVRVPHPSLSLSLSPSSRRRFRWRFRSKVEAQIFQSRRWWCVPGSNPCFSSKFWVKIQS